MCILTLASCYIVQCLEKAALEALVCGRKFSVVSTTIPIQYIDIETISNFRYIEASLMYIMIANHYLFTNYNMVLHCEEINSITVLRTRKW